MTEKATPEGVLEKWKQFDLSSLRNTLDAQAMTVTEAQAQSAESRKKLTEQTREFRKATEEEKLKSMGQLLRTYQQEIDKLTQRSKFAESSYLGIYASLANIPDPVQALATASAHTLKSSHITKLELQNKKLHQELEEFRREWEGIRNQDVTIRRLEDKIKDYETQLEDIVQKEVTARDKAKTEEAQRTIEQLQEREGELSFRLQQVSDELLKAQQNNKVIQSQYFELKSKQDEDHTSKQLEIEMMNDSVERLRSRLLAVETENEKLKEQSKSPRISRSPSSNHDNELVIAQKDVEISQLRDQISQIESQLDTELTNFNAEIAQLRKEQQNLLRQNESLIEEMKHKPSEQDLLDLTRQLEMFKALEYNITPSELTGGDEKVIYKILQEKNKHIENENMKLKLSLTTREEEVQQLHKEVDHLKQKLEEQSNKMAAMEEDISQGLRSSRNGNDSPFSSGNGGDSFIAGSASSQQTSQTRTSDPMFQVVCNQRDRLKAMVMDLETKVGGLTKQIGDFQSEISTVRGDNVKLYEKIRYLQSYGGMQRNGGGGGNETDLEKGAEDPVEGKYKKIYDENMNPFALFNRKEKLERYKELSTAERVTLRTGQFFLSNKYSRTFIFFYSIALHVLVMLILYTNAGKGTVYDLSRTENQ